MEELPLREIAEAIDDPFDDEQPQSNYLSDDEPEPADGDLDDEVDARRRRR